MVINANIKINFKGAVYCLFHVEFEVMAKIKAGGEKTYTENFQNCCQIFANPMY